MESISALANDKWRIPNITEPKNLVDITSSGPSLPNGHPFSNVQLTWYWSSTTHADAAIRAWGVNFWDGTIGKGVLGDKLLTINVWPVRGGNGLFEVGSRYTPFINTAYMSGTGSLTMSRPIPVDGIISAKFYDSYSGIELGGTLTATPNGTNTIDFSYVAPPASGGTTFITITLRDVTGVQGTINSDSYFLF